MTIATPRNIADILANVKPVGTGEWMPNCPCPGHSRTRGKQVTSAPSQKVDGIIALELAEELVARFGLVQLRYELHFAQINSHPELDDYPYWRLYSLAVEGAIDLLILTTPKPTPRLGHIDIETVRARADIFTLAEGYGLKLQKAGRNLKACCPFHQERTPSFYLYPVQNRFHCYGCQADGDAISFVMRMDGVDFKTAAGKVGGI